MTDIGQCQLRFLLPLFTLWLSIRGRYNFRNISRYSTLAEQTYAHNFSQDFDWLDFNIRLVQQALSTDCIIALDPSFITKSGKCSAGVGKYWSGAAGMTKWGQEFTGLAAVDLTDNTALHLEAVQTVLEEEDNLLSYYARIITQRAEALLTVSQHIVCDAYFAKASFVDQLTQAGFELITRLRQDQALRYYYHGVQRRGAGRPKTYDGKVDPTDLRADLFTPCAVADDGSWRAFEAVVHVNAWQRAARVVIIHRYDRLGTRTGYTILVSTDVHLSGGEIVLAYKARFQQEFLFRDAKQELGLQDCQAYTQNKINFHLNVSLTVGSLAKVAHHLGEQDKTDRPFSIADIKTRYVNEYFALRIIHRSGLDADKGIISGLIDEIKTWGLRRA